MNDPITRDLGGNPPQPAAFRRGRNIIAVVGINQYPYNQVLTRAVADALGVRKLFLETLGFEELVEPLYDQDATHSAITALVTDKLQNALKPDDSLVLFFAGHGHTEKGKAGTKETLTGYLIPHDGRNPAEKKFSTYLKLSSFLEDVANLPAMHILVIIDACRSGFALSDFANQYRGSPQAYEEAMSSRMSRRVITSASEAEDALDNGPLPENSLFTGALIEALEKGTADNAHLGFVTGSMLGLHLQQVVSTWSGSKQRPDFGSIANDDRGELVISLRGETQNRLLALDALEVARRYMTLGYATGDSQRFGAAVRQYQHAREFARLGRMDLYEAQLGECQAMVAAGQNEGAIQELAEILQAAGDSSPDEAFLLLGLAYAGLRNYSLAAANLRNWLDRCPDNENAGWAQEYLAWMEVAAGEQQNRISALLIGINAYELPGLPDLNGCVNDVEGLFQPLLLDRFQADSKQIRLLKDQFATRRRILEDLKQLSQRVTETESVLVYFSGHSIPSDEPYTPGWNDKDTYLLLADSTQKKGRYTNGLTALELHQAMLNLRAVNKTLVLDTHTSQAMIDLAESNGDYNLILASETGQTAHEWSVEKGGEKIPCGMLSGALYQVLHNATNLERLTYQQWIVQATQITLAASSSAAINAKPQTPRFVGNGDQIVFGGYDPFLKFFLFAQRKGWGGVDPDLLKTNYDRYHQYFKKPFPKAMEAFGNAFLAINDYPRAISAFQRTLEQTVTRRPGCLSGLAAAYALSAQYPTAAGYLQEYLNQAPPEQQERIQKMLAHLEQLAGVKRNVVIYLRETTREELETPPPDPANTYDTSSKGQLHFLREKLADVLAQKYGKEGFTLQFFTSDVKESQFLDEMNQFAGLSPQQPLLVCIFGGSETWTPNGPSSERLMDHLRRILGEAPAFIWLQRVPHTRSGTGSGTQETDPFDTSDANIAMLFEVLVQSLQVVTPGITPAAWRSSVQTGLSKIFAYQQAPDAMMALPRNGAFFLSTQEQSEFQAMMTFLRQTELMEVASFLSAQVEKHQEREDYWPEGRLQLGIAYALLSEYTKARQVLEDMVNFLESGGQFTKNVQMAA